MAPECQEQLARTCAVHPVMHRDMGYGMGMEYELIVRSRDVILFVFGKFVEKVGGVVLFPYFYGIYENSYTVYSLLAKIFLGCSYFTCRKNHGS
jgi:hypothetical protein